MKEKPTIMILKNLPTAKRQFTVHGFLAQGSFDSAAASSQEGLNDQSDDQSCTANAVPVPKASKVKKGTKKKK